MIIKSENSECMRFSCGEFDEKTRFSKNLTEKGM